jgi:hypothetical protein
VRAPSLCLMQIPAHGALPCTRSLLCLECHTLLLCSLVVASKQHNQLLPGGERTSVKCTSCQCTPGCFDCCRYSSSLYWAATTMSTTGYGDIVPLTNYERTYALLIMLVGVVVSAIVFGVLAQIITEAFDDLPSSAQKQIEVRMCLMTACMIWASVRRFAAIPHVTGIRWQMTALSRTSRQLWWPSCTTSGASKP